MTLSGDEEDQDYNPDEEPMEEDDDDLFQDLESSDTPLNLTSMQLKRIDDAFEDLFGYKWGTSFELPTSLTPQQELLKKILGPTRTASVLRLIGVSKPKVHSRKRPERKFTYKTTSPTVTGGSSRSSQITVGDRASMEDEATTSASIPPASGGMGRVLEQLKGDSSSTTIQKTSTDWDRFKEKSGLGEKLESQAESKTAYLKKQEFLTRVDHRQFEKERDERATTSRKRK